MGRYEEALERAKKELQACGSTDCDAYKQIIRLFPELAESEDEKIRKAIKNVIDNGFVSREDCHYFFDDYSKEEMLAWLEKQAEQKSADKSEPKFHEGNWIVFNGLTLYVKEVVKGYYRTISKDGIPNSYDWNIDSAARLWTIQEAKAGDVLVNWNNTIFIFRAIEDETVKFHIAYNEKWDTIKTPSTKLSHIGLPESQFEFHPTTKEQRNTLIKAMADAGYTFDFEKKELKKIEQKSAWSEEDEKVVHCLEYTVKHFYEDEDTIKWCCDWLKPLKDRILPKQEWSKEDERIRTCLIKDQEKALEDVENDKYGHSEIISDLKEMYRERIDWLKSLRPQKQQEWSKKDIDMIDWLIRDCEKKHEELCNDKYGHEEIVSDLKRDCRKKWDWLESLKNRLL